MRKGLFCFCSFVLLLIFAVVLCAFPRAVLGRISSFLLVDEEPQPSDAIVVLAGGEAERVLKAAELYHLGLAPRIVFIQGYTNPKTLQAAPSGFIFPGSGTIYSIALQSLGVPTAALVQIPSLDAFDTAHELHAVALYLRAQGWNSVILVTSAAHTRRSSTIWQRVSGGTKHYTVAAPVPGFEQWWKWGATRRAVAYEYGALIKEGWAQVEDFWTPEKRN